MKTLIRWIKIYWHGLTKRHGFNFRFGLTKGSDLILGTDYTDYTEACALVFF